MKLKGYVSIVAICYAIGILCNLLGHVDAGAAWFVGGVVIIFCHRDED